MAAVESAVGVLAAGAGVETIARACSAGANPEEAGGAEGRGGTLLAGAASVRDGGVGTRAGATAARMLPPTRAPGPAWGSTGRSATAATGESAAGAYADRAA
jgi:hypothetical protein